MKIHGTVFSQPMVQAIEKDIKFQTRRIMEPQPVEGGMNFTFTSQTGLWSFWRPHRRRENEFELTELRFSPYQQKDILYVKEAFKVTPPTIDTADFSVIYQANEKEISHWKDGEHRFEHLWNPFDERWRSPRFMFRDFARLWLSIFVVKPEFLSQISDADILAEGFKSREEMQTLWNKLHTRPGHRWEDNPAVWCYKFLKTASPDTH